MGQSGQSNRSIRRIKRLIKLSKCNPHVPINPRNSIRCGEQTKKHPTPIGFFHKRIHI